jgi:glutamine synthetase
MGDMLTRVIEDIIAGKTSKGAVNQFLKLGVARLPEIAQDNTDRNRTSPFAFTGAKFEFRAVGGSASIAFPIMLLNATVAEALGELTTELTKALKTTKKVDEAVLKVVRESFKDSSPIRFEGNNYSQEWVADAKKRGLPNLRGTPEALAQLLSRDSRAVLTRLGILTKAELESRVHVRLERYVKDLLIEMHTLRQIVDTMILPAAFSYLGDLSASAAQAKSAGIKTIPQVDVANRVGDLVKRLQTASEKLVSNMERVEGMHDDPEKQANTLTSDGAASIQAVREAADALELIVADEYWPLPKYREMLFPV